MATLKDVAQKAGVTVTTVSRVLNNRGAISEQTRRKVHDAMKALNYQPNMFARALSRQKADFIGLIVPSIRIPFFAEVAYYTERIATELGFKVILCNSNHQREKEIEYIDMLRSNKVGGVIVASHTQDLDYLTDMGMSVVAFERTASSKASLIACNNHQGGVLATRHLIERGCKRLVHISHTELPLMPANDRRIGFEDVCRQAGIPYRVYSITEERFHAMEYDELVARVFAEDEGMDGIFASNDIVAACVIQHCAELGIAIPQQLRLVGFDDEPFAGWLTPKLTTIRQPVAQMCRAALNLLAYTPPEGSVVTSAKMDVALIQRESS